MTSVQEYLEKMKEVQTNLIAFLDNEGDNSDLYQNLIQIFQDQKILDNKHLLHSTLRIIAKIAKYRHHLYDMYNKIQQILIFLGDKIKQTFTNTEIFKIFKGNKKVLLILYKHKIMTIDQSIIDLLFPTTVQLKFWENELHFQNESYYQYFYPEIKPFIDEKLVKNILKEIPENFEEKRDIGENDNYVCELIRNDSIEEFITYYHQNGFPLSSKVESSIFETNLLLNDVTLIEYAAAFGSIQILKYLVKNGIELSPYLMVFAFHSCNAEIIQLIEDNTEKLDDYFYLTCYRNAIKCYNREIAEYIKSNYLKEDESFLLNCIKYYNFEFIQNDSLNESVFYHLCKYGHYIPVEILLKNGKIDLNQRVVLYLFCNFVSKL